MYDNEKLKRKESRRWFEHRRVLASTYKYVDEKADLSVGGWQTRAQIRMHPLQKKHCVCLQP